MNRGGVTNTLHTHTDSAILLLRSCCDACRGAAARVEMRGGRRDEDDSVGTLFAVARGKVSQRLVTLRQRQLFVTRCVSLSLSLSLSLFLTRCVRYDSCPVVGMDSW